MKVLLYTVFNDLAADRRVARVLTIHKIASAVRSLRSTTISLRTGVDSKCLNQVALWVWRSSGRVERETSNSARGSFPQS